VHEVKAIALVLRLAESLTFAIILQEYLSRDIKLAISASLVLLKTFS